MGTYDYITCRAPMPLVGDAPLVWPFQTKDTPHQWFGQYEITADGHLVAYPEIASDGNQRQFSETPQSLPDFNGDVDFCGSTTNASNGDFFDYRASFFDGNARASACLNIGRPRITGVPMAKS